MLSIWPLDGHVLGGMSFAFFALYVSVFEFGWYSLPTFAFVLSVLAFVLVNTRPAEFFLIGAVTIALWTMLLMFDMVELSPNCMFVVIANIAICSFAVWKPDMEVDNGS
jgi:hypothetical protein